jgi:hypothetical protein
VYGEFAFCLLHAAEKVDDTETEPMERKKKMGPGSFRLYVCLLVILTSFNPSAVLAQARPRPRNPASRQKRSAQAEQQPSQPTSIPPENTPVQPAQGETSGPGRAAMTSADLINQLNQPEANVKSHILVIARKSISGDLKLGLEQLPVPFRVEFHNCEFTDNVVISNVVFDQGVVFNSVTFDKSFQFENDHIKGDLLLTNVHMARPEDQAQSGKPKPTTIQLNQSQVDGDLRIKNPEADKLEAESLTAGNVIIWLPKNGIPDLDLMKLETGRLSVAANAGTRVNQLQLNGSAIRETLALQNVVFQNVVAPNLTVSKRTQFLPTTVIDKRLDLSFSNLGNFDWEFPGDTSFQLPENVNLEGTTFSNLHVAPVFSGKAQSEDVRESRWRERRTDYGLALLEKATYYEPAYTAYESLLKSQGRGDSADAVYFAMRDRRRYTEWIDAATFSGRVVAGLNYVIGFGHKWLFGYGRAWVYPIVWCLAFIAAGAYVFRDVALMEKHDAEPTWPFSPLWYSIDLFVPVLSLGVANRWHPKSDRGFLVFYSKLLSLVGLVFLSAALGALTGSLK